MPTVYARTLRRAAQIVGTKELAAQLGISSDDLVYWMDGTKRVPQQIFLKAVDIVVAYDVKEMSNVKTPTIEKPE